MSFFANKKILLVFPFILCVIAVGGFFLFHKSQSSLISPVLGISKVRLADNIWVPLPSDGKAYDEKVASKISSQAAFFIETNTGQVLFEKNATQKHEIASLTKIMTTIVALENKRMDDVFHISEKAAATEPDKMFLIGGETLTLKELLEGIYLVSANDAAEAIAEGATRNNNNYDFSEITNAKRREEFIHLMNVKAKQIGMSNSFFINPSGLEEDGKEQYSNAYEVALMSRYAIRQWPELIAISSLPSKYIEKTAQHQDYDMYSGINLLTTYPGVVGFKTGYTPKAGLTLVTVARRGDKEVLGVLLGATNRRDDAKELLDYSFKKLGLP